MPIERHIIGPRVGWFEQDVYDTFGFADVVRAGDWLHFSGIVPLKGDMANLEVIHRGDFRGQYTWALEMLGTLLEKAGGTYPGDVVKVSVMVTSMASVNENCDVFAEAFAGAYPAAKYIGVAELFHPEQLVEIDAVAYIGD